MARNMYGATSADFTLTSGGRVVPGATLTIWSARTGGTQITDLLDVDSVATTTVTSDADGSIVYYGPDNDKTVHWADSGVGSRIAIRPVDITGDPPVLSIGTVGTGAAAASLTGTSEAPVLNLTLPSAGANGVNTAAIQDGAVTPAKLATSGRFVFPTGATGGYGFASGAVHLSGTGSPVGVVTAAPGSSFLQIGDAATASGNLLWRKISGTGNVGWMPEGALADTGWRNVTAAMDSTFKTNRPNGALYLRRQGSLCEVRFIETGTPTAMSGLIYDMPDGFWGNGSAKATTVMLNADTVVGTTASMLVTYTHGEWLYCAGWGTVPYVGSLTWTTTRDWPSSLPGAAV